MTCEEVLKMVLQSPVVAACVVGLFSVLSIRMGLGRFRSERWWERKAIAYASVLDGLHSIKHHTDVWLDAIVKDYEVDDEYSEKLSPEYANAFMEVKKGASVGSFVMTKTASMILQDLSPKLEGFNPGSGPPHEYYEQKLEAVEDAIIGIQREAKRDLRT